MSTRGHPDRYDNLSSVRMVYSTLDVNFAVFRDFQELPRSVLELLYRRTALGNYLAKGIIEDALSPGFDIVDMDNEVVDIDYDHEAFAKDLEVYIEAKAASRAYSHAVLANQKFDDSNKERVLFWIEDTHINELDTITGTRKITKFSFSPPIGLSLNVEPMELTAQEDLDNLMLLGQTSELMGYFRSYFEPISDRLISIAIHDQQLTLVLVRLGSGIRYILASEAALSNPQNRTKFEKMLNNMGMNLLLAVPSDGEIGKDFEFGVKFGEGTPPVTPSEALDSLLTPISIYSKMPKEGLKGGELGLRSSEVNRKKTLDAFTDIQKECSPDILKLMRWRHGLTREDVRLRWKPLVELDETEIVDLLTKKFNLVKNLLPHLDEMGLTLEALYDKLDLDIEIDEALRQQAIEERKALNAQVTEGIQSDNGKTNIPTAKVPMAKVGTKEPNTKED